MKNIIKIGSIEYYELIELRDKINNSDYSKFNLKNLDKLRIEIDSIIENIKPKSNNMTAKQYLKKIAIDDRVVNREDLPEYHKSISTLMEEYSESLKNIATTYASFCVISERSGMPLINIDDYIENFYLEAPKNC